MTRIRHDLPSPADPLGRPPVPAPPQTDALRLVAALHLAGAAAAGPPVLDPHVRLTPGAAHVDGRGWVEAHDVAGLWARERLDLDEAGRLDVWLSGLDPDRPYVVAFRVAAVRVVPGACFQVTTTGGPGVEHPPVPDQPVWGLLPASRVSDMAKVRLAAVGVPAWSFYAAEVFALTA